MRIQSLSGRKCLITGAASGIGRATARAAAREGAVLFLTDRNGPGLEAVARDIRQDGGKIAMLRAFDISDYEAVRGFAADVHAAHGSLDVLMNIAGISIWGPVEQLRHDQWRRAVDINLMGPIHVIECFLPEMIRAGRGGWLVNVSSAAGLFGLPWHAAYSASKFGLRGVSEVLRFDLQRHRIGVSLVCPGGVDTGLVDTIEIEGLDLKDPRAIALKRRFRRRAVSADQAAQTLLKGMKRGRYLVYTSPDILMGHWLQRVFAPGYEFIMRRLNNHLVALIQPARVQT